MRKLAMVLGVVVLAVGAGALASGNSSLGQQAPGVSDSVVAPVLAATDTADFPGPRQPIFFRHDIHAGQYKMQCQYCHYSVEASSEPGIPSMQTCMGCHLVIAGNDSSSRAEIAKVRDAYNANEPIEWVRTHALARHAHFPHMRHVKEMGPNACMTCHGDVSRMPQVYQVNNIGNMGWCIGCHLERDISRDCSVCHY